MTHLHMRFISVALAILLCGEWTLARLKLAAPFSDHMVLQRDRPIRVWGTAEPGATVAVQLAEQRVSASADANGRWRAELKPQRAGGPVDLRVSSGDQTVTLTDVLIGDVFLCSGQSNMQMSLREADGGRDVANSAAALGQLRSWARPARA